MPHPSRKNEGEKVMRTLEKAPKRPVNRRKEATRSRPDLEAIHATYSEGRGHHRRPATRAAARKKKRDRQTKGEVAVFETREGR